MQRRDFITLLGGAIAAPGAALAQPTKVYRVGVLLLGNADAASFQTQLSEGLGKSGYLEHQNLLLEFRSAEGKLDLLPQLAAELVALGVDLILTRFTPAAIAAMNATKTIPIVMTSTADPFCTGAFMRRVSTGPRRATAAGRRCWLCSSVRYAHEQS